MLLLIVGWAIQTNLSLKSSFKSFTNINKICLKAPMGKYVHEWRWERRLAQESEPNLEAGFPLGHLHIPEWGARKLRDFESLSELVDRDWCPRLKRESWLEPLLGLKPQHRRTKSKLKVYWSLHGLQQTSNDLNFWNLNQVILTAVNVNPL